MSASSAAWAVRCRGCRSSRSRGRTSTNGKNWASGSARSSARSTSASAAARVAESIAGDRVDEQRLDEGARVQHGRGAVQHGSEGLDRCTAQSPSARQTAARRGARLSPAGAPGPTARPATCAGLRRPAESQQRQHEQLAHLGRQGVRRHEQALQPLGGAEGGERLLAAGPGRARSMPRARWTSSAVAGSRSGRSAASARSSQTCAASNRACATSISPIIASATQTIGWVDSPCASAIAIACAHRSPNPREGVPRVEHREVAQTADLDVRQSDPPRQLEPLLQVPAGLVESIRPELDDAEVHQRRGPGLVAEARPRSAFPPPRGRAAPAPARARRRSRRVGARATGA